MKPEDRAQHLKDLQKTVGWQILHQHLTAKQAVIAKRLLTEKDFDKVKQLQEAHLIYGNVLNFVTTNGHEEERQ